MKFGDKKISLDDPKVMGVVNVTPDSFSDGGRFNTVDKALEQATKMQALGASFIDVGGESTRPGAKEVSVEEELSRVLPVIQVLSDQLDCVISIDTSKPQVMQKAVEAGAGMINDVRALSLPGALEVASQLAQNFNVPTCVMHMQGNPQTMQNNPSYDSVVQEVTEFFRTQIDRLMHAGFNYDQILLDPGFGFGKTLEHNYQLLKHLDEFTQFDVPLLVGMSRKSMIGNLLDKPVEKRLNGDVASHTIAAINGASILRVHDVDAIMDAVKIVNKINHVS